MSYLDEQIDDAMKRIAEAIRTGNNVKEVVSFIIQRIMREAYERGKDENKRQNEEIGLV